MASHARDVCKGYLLGDDSCSSCLKAHKPDRRDKFCSACVAKRGLGVRSIDRDRIKVLPACILAGSKHNCQVGSYRVTGSAHARAASVQIKKRHHITDHEGKKAVQRIEFVHASGRVLQSAGSIDMLAVEVQEVGGATHHENYAAGTSRVPPKHCGEGASVVLVFATAFEAARFAAAFLDAFGVPVAGLERGLEKFIFDAKRAAFAPYCSILTRLTGYVMPPCSQCAGINHRDLCLDGRSVAAPAVHKPAKAFDPTALMRDFGVGNMFTMPYAAPTDFSDPAPAQGAQLNAASALPLPTQGFPLQAMAVPSGPSSVQDDDVDLAGCDSGGTTPTTMSRVGSEDQNLSRLFVKQEEDCCASPCCGGTEDGVLSPTICPSPCCALSAPQPLVPTYSIKSGLNDGNGDDCCDGCLDGSPLCLATGGGGCSELDASLSWDSILSPLDMDGMDAAFSSAEENAGFAALATVAHANTGVQKQNNGDQQQYGCPMMAAKEVENQVCPNLPPQAGVTGVTAMLSDDYFVESLLSSDPMLIAGPSNAGAA